MSQGLGRGNHFPRVHCCSLRPWFFRFLAHVFISAIHHHSSTVICAPQKKRSRTHDIRRFMKGLRFKIAKSRPTDWEWDGLRARRTKSETDLEWDLQTDLSTVCSRLDKKVNVYAWSTRTRTRTRWMLPDIHKPWIPCNVLFGSFFHLADQMGAWVVAAGERVGSVGR